MFDPYFTPEILFFHTAIFLGGVVLAIRKGFESVDGWVDRWASPHGVTLTDQTRPLVTHHLQRGRRIRTVGFLIGWSVPYVGFWIVRDVSAYDASPLAGWSQAAFIPGYLIAAIVAEVTAHRGEQRRGVASLEPRRLDAYLPRWARVGPWVTAAVGMATVGVYAVVPWREPEGFGPSVAGQLRTALWLAGVVVGIEVIQRFIVRRRQPYGGADMTEADDALRSSSVSILAGVSVALALNIWGSLMWNLGTRTDLQVLRWIAPSITLGMTIVGLVVFMRLSDPLLQWRVRRGESLRQPA